MVSLGLPGPFDWIHHGLRDIFGLQMVFFPNFAEVCIVIKEFQVFFFIHGLDSTVFSMIFCFFLFISPGFSFRSGFSGPEMRSNAIGGAGHRPVLAHRDDNRSRVADRLTNREDNREANCLQTMPTWPKKKEGNNPVNDRVRRRCRRCCGRTSRGRRVVVIGAVIFFQCLFYDPAHWTEINWESTSNTNRVRIDLRKSGRRFFNGKTSKPTIFPEKQWNHHRPANRQMLNDLDWKLGWRNQFFFVIQTWVYV